MNDPVEAGEDFAKGEKWAVKIRQWDGAEETFLEFVRAPCLEAAENVGKYKSGTLRAFCETIIRQNDLNEQRAVNICYDFRDKLDRKHLEDRSIQAFLGALSAIWPATKLPIEQLVFPSSVKEWTDLVAEELPDLSNTDKEKVAAADKLLELVARTFMVDEAAAAKGAPEDWRRGVVDVADHLQALALCRRGDQPRLDRDEQTASLLLGIYARLVQNNGRMKLDELVAELATNDKPLHRPLSRLLAHLARSNALVRALLTLRTDFEPWERTPETDLSVKNFRRQLQNEILLIGPPEVGKTAFLFASEQAHLADGRLPHIIPTHRVPAILEAGRSRWQQGTPSYTDDFHLTAKVHTNEGVPFSIVDPPGESVAGVQARSGGARAEHLRAGVEHLLPAVIVIVIDPTSQRDSGPNNPGREDVVEAVRRTLDAIHAHEGSTKPATIPIYLALNKWDVLMEVRFPADQTEENRRAELLQQTLGKDFPLAPYLAPIPANGDFADRLERDFTTENNLTVQTLLSDIVSDWSDLLKVLAESGHTDVTLVPMTSLYDSSGSSLGVLGFWRHFVNVTVPKFKAAHRQTIDYHLKELERQLEYIQELRCTQNGIALPDLETIRINYIHSLLEMFCGKRVSKILTMVARKDLDRQVFHQIVAADEQCAAIFSQMSLLNNEGHEFAKSLRIRLKELLRFAGIPSSPEPGKTISSRLCGSYLTGTDGWRAERRPWRDGLVAQNISGVVGPQLTAVLSAMEDVAKNDDILAALQSDRCKKAIAAAKPEIAGPDQQQAMEHALTVWQTFASPQMSWALYHQFYGSLRQSCLARGLHPTLCKTNPAAQYLEIGQNEEIVEFLLCAPLATAPKDGGELDLRPSEIQKNYDLHRDKTSKDAAITAARRVQSSVLSTLEGFGDDEADDKEPWDPFAGLFRFDLWTRDEARARAVTGSWIRGRGEHAADVLSELTRLAAEANALDLKRDGAAVRVPREIRKLAIGTICGRLLAEEGYDLDAINGKVLEFSDILTSLASALEYDIGVARSTTKIWSRSPSLGSSIHQASSALTPFMVTGFVGGRKLRDAEQLSRRLRFHKLALDECRAIDARLRTEISLAEFSSVVEGENNRIGNYNKSVDSFLNSVLMEIAGVHREHLAYCGYTFPPFDPADPLGWIQPGAQTLVERVKRIKEIFRNGAKVSLQGVH